MSGSYRDSKIWRKGIELVLDIYSSIRSSPRGEVYGLANQLRLAAVSVQATSRKQRADAPTRNSFSCCIMLTDRSSK